LSVQFLQNKLYILQDKALAFLRFIFKLSIIFAQKATQIFSLGISVVVGVSVLDVTPEGRGHVLLGRIHLLGLGALGLIQLLLIGSFYSNVDVGAFKYSKIWLHHDCPKCLH
jgi:hypothetical protein